MWWPCRYQQEQAEGDSRFLPLGLLEAGEEQPWNYCGTEFVYGRLRLVCARGAEARLPRGL